MAVHQSQALRSELHGLGKDAVFLVVDPCGQAVHRVAD
jgi:hypothetical protein